jgi:hypothetical protein
MASTTPDATPTAPTHRKSSTGLKPTPLPPVGDLGMPVQLGAGSVSISVVETCRNILEALKRDRFEELYEVIKNIMPAVTSDDNNAAFTDADVQVTMFVPPRADMAGVLHAFRLGDLTAREVLFSALDNLLIHDCHLLLLFQRFFGITVIAIGISFVASTFSVWQIFGL